MVLFGALLVAGWWLARGRGPQVMAAALWAGAATLLAVALNQPLVHGFDEARPYSVAARTCWCSRTGRRTARSPPTTR